MLIKLNLNATLCCGGTIKELRPKDQSNSPGHFSFGGKRKVAFDVGGDVSFHFVVEATSC